MRISIAPMGATRRSVMVPLIFAWKRLEAVFKKELEMMPSITRPGITNSM